ncbi:MAG: hypothetical protein KAG70_12130 [Alcanivorax sp.]|nr:hypothetical protein [Alcanivorax sp.]
MLMVFLILPIYVLIFNMGYNGIRQRESQSALRLSAFTFVDELATGDTNSARDAAQSNTAAALFSGESNALKLGVSGQNNPPNDPNFPTGPEVEGLFGTVSFRHAVTVEVSRTPPYDVFPSTPIKRSLIVASNTFTYCELQDGLFKNTGFNEGLLGDVASLLGKTALWPFGWIPDGKDVCHK